MARDAIALMLDVPADSFDVNVSLPSMAEEPSVEAVADPPE